jgi:hypothetical protein
MLRLVACYGAVWPPGAKNERGRPTEVVVHGCERVKTGCPHTENHTQAGMLNS